MAEVLFLILIFCGLGNGITILVFIQMRHVRILNKKWGEIGGGMFICLFVCLFYGEVFK